MNIVCIDPGIHKIGVFAKVGEKIVLWDTIDTREKTRGPEAWRSTSRALQARLPNVTWDVICVELMVVYTTLKGMPKDLLEVQGAAGTFVGMLSSPTTKLIGYPATTWTKGVPKDVRHRRITQHPDRLPIVRPSKRLLDAWDAYGIYLYYMEHDYVRPGTTEIL